MTSAPAYVGVARNILKLLSRGVPQMSNTVPASASDKRAEAKSELDARNVEDITQNLMESGMFSESDMESNLWLFVRDPEDIQIKTLRIKQLMTLHDLNLKTAPTWFVHSLYAFNYNKIPKLLAKYKINNANKDVKSIEGFNERVSLLSDLLKLPPFDIISKVDSYPSLITLPEADIRTRYDVLKNEAHFDEADLQQRPYLLQITAELMRERIKLFKAKNMKLQPHMFLVSFARLEKLFVAIEDTKKAFEGDENVVAYLSRRLNVSPEDVAMMAAKTSSVDLLVVNPRKVSNMVEMLLKEGYTEEEIFHWVPRVFEYSVPFVEARIRRYKEVLKQRPALYLFRVSNQEFEFKLEVGLRNKKADARENRRDRRADVMQVRNRLQYMNREDAEFRKVDLNQINADDAKLWLARLIRTRARWGIVWIIEKTLTAKRPNGVTLMWETMIDVGSN